jgi:glucose-6-phosphate dehydrogenase assembly protein OpcA
VGGDAGASEVVVLRLYGPLVDHGASVVVPLLLADAPVVVWWPGEAPEIPSQDPIGMLGERRITDAASAKRPMAQLAKRRDSYRPGDTDLSWTRITRWRGLLASTMDQPPHDKVTGATVAGAADSPSADLLAGWLALALKVPVKRVKSPAKSGPGLHSVILNRRCGDISLIRPQTITAELKVANQPERHVALPRRGLRDCLSEELRRLDADDVYAEVLTKGMALVAKQAATDAKPPSTKASTTKAAQAATPTAVKAPAKPRAAAARRSTRIAAAAAAVDDPPAITDDGSPTGTPGPTPVVASPSTNGASKPARTPRASSSGADAPKPAQRRRSSASSAVPS